MKNVLNRQNMAVLFPLLFSTSGGMEKAATTTYKHLAQLLSEEIPYSVIMG